MTHLDCLATASTQPCTGQHRAADHPRHLEVKMRVKSIYIINYSPFGGSRVLTGIQSLHPRDGLYRNVAKPVSDCGETEGAS